VNYWAIVPVKPLAQAKSRLAGVLAPEQRVELVTRLLQRTLAVLRGTESLARVLVVSADPYVERLAHADGAEFLAEAQPQGLNSALTKAVAHAQEHGAEAVLILPADLPHLRRESLLPLLALAATPPTIGIAPDRWKQGTNALLIAPAMNFPFAFGANSFQTHLALAQKLGMRVAIYHDPDLAMDIDLPEDLTLMKEHP